MKAKRIKKIGVLLVFSIFVSLISFNMAWAESKTFYFVLNDQDDWTYTLGDPANGGFTVDVPISGEKVYTTNTYPGPTFDWPMPTDGIIPWGFNLGSSMDGEMTFKNGVPTSKANDFWFKISFHSLCITCYDHYELFVSQEKGGRKEGNIWTLTCITTHTVDPTHVWTTERVIASGNWFFVPKDYVEWSAAPRTPKIPRYDTPILTNVNNMVDFTPIRGTYSTICFTDDFPPSECGCPDTAVGLFSFQAVLENTSCTSLTDLTVKVHTLTNDNLLVLARGNSLPEDFVGAEIGGEGALWTLPASGYYDILYQGPSKAALPRFGICLKEIKRFDFYVDVLGTVR